MRRYLFRVLAVLHLVLGVMYLYWRITQGLWGDAPWLSLLFLAAEGFTLIAIVGFFLSQLGSSEPTSSFEDLSQTLGELPYVDVFVVRRHEDPQATRQTAQAALQLRYPWHRLFVHILDLQADDTLRQIALKIPCEYYRCPSPDSDPLHCILNDISTFGEFILVVDAGQGLEQDLIEQMVPYFYDHGDQAPILNRTGYVQAMVRVIGKRHFDHPLQQSLPVNQGGGEAAPLLGTAVIFRRSAVESLKDSWDLSQPVAMGTALHQQGWKAFLCSTAYVEGSLFPLRNRRAALLSVLSTLKQNPILSGQTSQVQRFEYLWLGLWSIGGIATLIYYCIPIVFLGFGITPVPAFDRSFFVWFLPYVISGRLAWLAAFGPGRWGAAWRAERQTGSQFFQSIQALIQFFQGVQPRSEQPSQLSLGPQALVILITLISIIVGSIRFMAGWSVDPVAFGFGLVWACYTLLLLSVRPSDFDLIGYGGNPEKSSS